MNTYRVWDLLRPHRFWRGSAAKRIRCRLGHGLSILPMANPFAKTITRQVNYFGHRRTDRTRARFDQEESCGFVYSGFGGDHRLLWVIFHGHCHRRRPSGRRPRVRRRTTASPIASSSMTNSVNSADIAPSGTAVDWVRQRRTPRTRIPRARHAASGVSRRRRSRPPCATAPNEGWLWRTLRARLSEAGDGVEIPGDAYRGLGSLSRSGPAAPSLLRSLGGPKSPDTTYEARAA
jgi:hypothetical protein